MMLRLTVVECARLPLVPAMVRVNVPVVTVLRVETFSVEEPAPPLIEVGLKLPLAAFGNPLTLRLTVPAKPFSGATDTV